MVNTVIGCLVVVNGRLASVRQIPVYRSPYHTHSRGVMQVREYGYLSRKTFEGNSV